MNKCETETNGHSTCIFNAVLLILRIVVGVVMAAHGAQKVFGAFGGMGLDATVGFMGPVGYLVSVGEFFGGLGMLLGFLTRFSALSNIVIQVGAIVKVHWVNGFFLGANPGFEFNYTLIGILICLVIAGPGRYAIIRLAPKGMGKIIPFIE